MMWRKSFRTSFALAEDILFLQSEVTPGKMAFTTPLGNVERGVELLSEYCREMGEELCFCSIGEEDKEKLLSLLPEFSATPTRDWFDYLYLSESLATFRGKKLSGQRNHKNFFMKNHSDWQFEKICDENLSDVKAFFDFYCEINQKDSDYFYQEAEAVREVLDHLEEYGFVGGLVRAEGKVCAFSFGEVIGDTLFVHIEKADRDIRGSYQMMVSEFASRYATEGVEYINREEDVGDPGLRYSKESYHPHALLTKYIIERGK